MRKIAVLWMMALAAQVCQSENLGDLQRQEGDYRVHRQWDQDAETLKKIIALWSQRFGADSVGISTYYSRLGGALTHTGDYAGAEQAFRSCLSILEAGGPLYSFAANGAKRQLVWALKKEDKASEADQLRASVTPDPKRPKPDTNAELIDKHGEAKYTDAARKKGVSGDISLFLEIDETGRVTAAHVLEPLGFGLDENAVIAVGKWKFKPALLNGAPIASTAIAGVSFHRLN